MIKKGLLAFSLLFLFSAAAFSDTARPYIGFKGAVSFIESNFDLGYYYDYHRRHYYNNYYYEDRYYDKSTDTVFAGSAALGVKVLKYTRFEVEYTHRTEAKQSYRWFPDIKQEFDSFMANVFFDLDMTPSFVPYMGFGLGLTHVEDKIFYTGTKKQKSDDCFSASIDFGISFVLTKHLNLDVGCRVIYLGASDIEYEDYYMYAVDLYSGLRLTI
ncbi:MAG: porin family protein [Endomicrobium sp.]|jgi:opacity protein-like surface antigen|nr:porin family protein [Endomicrobium sp.]